jgi:hypothetical protein
LVFAESHAAVVKNTVITIAKTMGAMKKYLQLKIVTTAKQMTSDHAGPRMSAKVSGASYPAATPILLRIQETRTQKDRTQRKNPNKSG